VITAERAHEIAGEFMAGVNSRPHYGGETAVLIGIAVRRRSPASGAATTPTWGSAGSDVVAAWPVSG